MSRSYEDLRTQATGIGFVSATPRGLAVFTRGGMAAWMDTWRCLVEQPSTVTSRHLDDGASLPPASELACLLADMAMQRGRWMHAR
jgi:hypothetical protein